MTDGSARGASRADGFRRAFDLEFSRQPRTETKRDVELLAIRVCGDPWALRLSEVAGLLAGRRITPAPSAVPEFLGLVGFRGGIHTAYSLRGFLGYPSGDAPRWIVLVKAGDLVGLAFDDYEGYQSVPERDLAPRARGGSRTRSRGRADLRRAASRSRDFFAYGSHQPTVAPRGARQGRADP